MSESEEKPELEATATGNGSRPPGDTGRAVIPEKKTDEEENGANTFDEESEGKREEQAEGVKSADAEGVKMPEGVDTMATKTVESEDVKVEEGKGMETVEAVDLKILEAEATKTLEVENTNMPETEDVKISETTDVKMQVVEDAKMSAFEDVKIADAKDVKKQEAEDAKMPENMDMKTTETQGVKVMESEDTEMPEDENEVEDARMAEVADAKDNETSEREGQEDGMKETIEKKDEESSKKEDEESKVAKALKKKRVRGQGVEEKGEGKEKKENETKEKEKEKELLRSPTASSLERPVRERKTVERLVEVLEKEQVKKFVIEKGCGIPLKDIPNVARKLARKKPADLKLLHQALFGRFGKAVDFKNHILQFSGFAWHESEEKQKTKLKEKLDKYVKETLLDLCDLFNIPVSKATMRKEELVAMLLDFMAAPHVMANAVLTEKEQQSMKKRKSVGEESPPKSLGGIPAQWSKKKRTKNQGTPKTVRRSDYELEEYAEEEEKEHGVPKEDEAPQHFDKDKNDSETMEEAEEDNSTDDDSRKGKQNLKRSSKRRGSASTEKLKVVFSTKKTVLPSTTKSLSEISATEQSKSDESKDVVAKVFSRKKKDADAPKKKSNPPILERKKKTIGKDKAKSKETKESGLSKEELRNTICEILKDVDFNTATFTDIFKQLASHYNMDLTRRKGSIKLIVEEELTKLADEAEDNEDDEGGGTDEDENPEPMCKEIKA